MDGGNLLRRFGRLQRMKSQPLSAEAVQALKKESFPHSLALRLQSDRGGELVDMLSAAVTTMSVGQADLDELAADFASIYLNHGYGASPYESVWLDEDGLAMQQPMFDVRESYARHGLSAPDWRKRADDHVVFQLQFIATMLEAEDGIGLPHVVRFLDKHTLRWMPDFATRVGQRAATPFYAGLAMLTATYLDELRDVLALANAAVDGPRYIVVGIEFDAKGRKRIHPVDRDDFSGKPAYHALVTDHIEPPIRVRYQSV